MPEILDKTAFGADVAKSIDTADLATSSDRDEWDEQWERSLANAPPVKASTTRLLDMLAGWERYAAADEFPDSAAAKAAVLDLYEEAGQIAFDASLSPKEQDEKIRAFLLERVFPTLTM